eukprot:845872-Lingulodinium_polyedra.AAC.1
MQPVTSVTTKRGKTIGVGANEAASKLIWGDPILITAMQGEFQPDQLRQGMARRCRAWTISTSTR